jgi:hypothetical protein
VTDKTPKTRQSVEIALIDNLGCAVQMIAFSVSALLLAIAAAIWFTWVV